MHIALSYWIGLHAFILSMLALDLGVFNRRPHIIGMREALGWSALWITLSFVFNALLFVRFGPGPAQEFLAGYLIEYSLSVDNIFIFVLIFNHFHVASKYQHRVLFWGILSALVFRGAMIAAGAALLHQFSWIIYVFGGFLIFTGFRMAVHDSANLDPSESKAVKWSQKLFPMTTESHGRRFLIRSPQGWHFTPLFVVLLVVETTDIVFALDSIPAIFAVTNKPFIVYTSNVFAILGLRSLYFLMAGAMGMFRYLKLGLSAVLVFVGVKMLIGNTVWRIAMPAALTAIAGILSVSILFSILAGRLEKNDHTGSGR